MAEHQITRTDEQVDDLLNRAAEEFETASSVRSDAVTQTVLWLTGKSDEDPLG